MPPSTDATRTGQGSPGTPKRKAKEDFPALPAAWDVEIGCKTADFEFVDDDENFGTAHRQASKLDLAKICGCGINDRCWAVAYSMKPWPLKLELCNRAKHLGHEAYDTDLHTFTAKQTKELHDLFHLNMKRQRSK